MDDYETHDERRLIPGTGFTIEPGVYTEQFGVRTEINMFIGRTRRHVTGPCRRVVTILPLGQKDRVSLFVESSARMMSTAKDHGFLRGADSRRVDWPSGW